MNEFQLRRFLSKPQIEYDPTHTVTIIFTNGRTITHEKITYVTEFPNTIEFGNSYESFTYNTAYILAFKMRKD